MKHCAGSLAGGCVMFHVQLLNIHFKRKNVEKSHCQQRAPPDLIPLCSLFLCALGSGDSDTPYGGKGHRIAQRSLLIITINPRSAFKRNSQYICGRVAAGAAGYVEAAAAEPSDSVVQTTCLLEEQTRRHVAEHARGLLSHPAVKRGGAGERYIIRRAVFASNPLRLSDPSDKASDKSEGLLAVAFMRCV